MPTLRDAQCVSLSVAFTVLLLLSALVHTMTRLTDALAARFTDADEIKDVAQYGCSGGVSGFIYYKEIRDFFNEHEDDIENTIADLGYDIKDLVDVNTDSVMELINKMVWLVVENYCQEQAEL
jgi:hypothetical protein